MVEEQKQQLVQRVGQLTLDNFNEDADSDPEYGHLTRHLVEAEAGPADNNQWTRCFTRDEVRDLQIGVHQLGPDLVFDKSLRESAEKRSNAAGEVVFSPMLFKAADLSQELSQSEISLSSLLGLGEIVTKVKARF